MAGQTQGAANAELVRGDLIIRGLTPQCVVKIERHDGNTVHTSGDPENRPPEPTIVFSSAFHTAAKALVQSVDPTAMDNELVEVRAGDVKALAAALKKATGS
jgi:hypothetical protein